MAFDPNLYAIQIELSIDAGEAFNTISDLEDAIVGIEQRLSTSIANSLEDIAQLSSQFVNELDAASLLMSDIGSTVDDQVDQFGDTFERQLDYNDSLRSRQEIEEEIQEMLEERRIIYDLFETVNERIMAIQLDSNFHSRQQREILNDITDLMREIGFSNAEINNFLNESNISTNNWESELRDVVRAVDEIKDAMLGTVNALSMAVKGTEEFVTANYRAFGSQIELLTQAKQLAAEYGVFEDQAIEAYKSLMGIDVPAEQLAEYAGMVAQTSRITGVGIRTIGEYTRQVRAAGLSYDQTSDALAVLSAAQEEFALSTETVNRILDEHLQKLGLLTSMYGDKVPEQLNVASAIFADIVQSSGAAESALTDFNKTITATGREGLKLEALYGEKFMEGVEGRFDAVMDKTQEFANRMEDMRDEQGQLSSMQLHMLEQEAKHYGISIDMIQALNTEIRAAAERGEEFSIEYSEMAEKLGEAADRERQMTDATNSLYKAMNELYTAASAVIFPFIAFVADGLVPVVQWISSAIEQISSLINYLTSLWMALEETIPYLSTVRQAFQTMISVFIVGGIAIVSLVGIIGTLSGALVSLIGLLTGGGAAAATFAGAISASLTSIATAITAFATTVTTVITTMAAALRQVALPLLALGAAFLMVAGGAWIFTQAVLQLAEGGMAAALAMTGMVAAIIVLGVALAVLGTIVQGPIALGVIVIAGALLAAGAAAWLMGQGIKAAAEGLVMMLEAIDISSAGQLTLFAIGVAALGAAGMMASPGIIALAGAFWLMGNKAIIVGEGLKLVADAMETITNINFSRATRDITAFSAALINDADEMVDALSILSSASRYAEQIQVLVVVLDSLSNVELGNVGSELVKFASDVQAAAETIDEDSTRLYVAANRLSNTGYLLVTAGYSISGGSISLAFATSLLSNSVKNLEDAASAFEAFNSAVATANNISFGPLRLTILEFSDLVVRLASEANSLEQTAKRLSEITIPDLPLIDDIDKITNDLTEAVEKMAIPIAEFEDQIEALANKIDDLVEAEAKLRDVGTEISDALNPQDNDNDNKPNEFRNVPQVNEMINAVVEAKADNEEMIDLLQQILAELKKDKQEREPFFGKDAQAPNEREKLKDAGVI